MLTHLQIRNFKKFEDSDIELGNAVVLIGPNNSGKTTALQALALWDIGLRRWNEKRKGGTSPEKRSGVTVNRRDLTSIPVPVANLLWRNSHVREVASTGKGESRVRKTENVRVEIIVRGEAGDKAWECGLEFDYANEESFYCRPLRTDQDGSARMPIPKEAAASQVAFLPPMSGLADREYLKQAGEIGVLIGQGQTAQVLRNLCFQLFQRDPEQWSTLAGNLDSLFGVTLLDPKYIPERSEIVMEYRDRHKNTFDLSSSGRGLQQTLLLLSHLYNNPKTILLLDEPDAHLEILRQRQIYNLLIEISHAQGSQIIAASHSEVILNEAAGRDTVVAFVGKPHRIDDKNSQVVKSLRNIGFDQFYQAEETGWVLYLEDSTDLAILLAFARTLKHQVAEVLSRPFVKYVESNVPSHARNHFRGLMEAKPDLVGVALFDRLEKGLQPTDSLNEIMWSRREIENYFCTEEILLTYARGKLTDDMFANAEAVRRESLMRESIELVTQLLLLDNKTPWSKDVKASDEVLDRVFRDYFRRLGLSVEFRKSDYHLLAGLVPASDLDPEVTEKLDAIWSVVQRASPRKD